MELRYKIRPNDTTWIVRFERFAEEYTQTEQAVHKRFGHNLPLDWVNGQRIHAWLPPYDNYDSGEKFWRHYELSLLS